MEVNSGRENVGHGMVHTQRQDKINCELMEIGCNKIPNVN